MLPMLILSAVNSSSGFHVSITLPDASFDYRVPTHPTLVPFSSSSVGPLTRYATISIVVFSCTYPIWSTKKLRELEVVHYTRRSGEKSGIPEAVQYVLFSQ